MTEQSLDFDYMFKFVIIGDSSVGKSCILSRINGNTFKDNHEVTLGVDIATKILKVQGKIIKARIWDTAGQENFRSITRSYYRGAIGIMLVFDMKNRESFENIKSWQQEINQYANEKIKIILIANKSDLMNKREVTTEEGQQLAKKIGSQYIETSALNGKNIEETLQLLSQSILKLISENQIDLTNKNCGVLLPNKTETPNEAITQDKCQC
ncbi:unnamed protein product (macronuclear) [Paramecium tetraurelia]|uniref:Chromosome undetermined scaffold_23, whole genome shotgun sequence n=1 Tax=Paramecium tetraurelia TaxID=5888 RepID=Q3SD56_PARTE|nr:uncharacterized protein GSPATT00008937001 [Paramecium tetraurelia]CAI44509.1 rab_C22 [Paramecium tetraurelia]CAK72546.1 unnamed protein product [Paramecium tetraurelia]|eukprot:XP_001439943.1 hypothetical protein (macronuclear) [Paramecium tetraurelia strain d4-2]